MKHTGKQILSTTVPFTEKEVKYVSCMWWVYLILSTTVPFTEKEVKYVSCMWWVYLLLLLQYFVL